MTLHLKYGIVRSDQIQLHWTSNPEARSCRRGQFQIAGASEGLSLVLHYSKS